MKYFLIYCHILLINFRIARYKLWTWYIKTISINTMLPFHFQFYSFGGGEGRGGEGRGGRRGGEGEIGGKDPQKNHNKFRTIFVGLWTRLEFYCSLGESFFFNMTALSISSVDATFEFLEIGNHHWSIFYRNLAISLMSWFDLKRYPGSEEMNDFASSLSLCLRSSYEVHVRRICSSSSTMGLNIGSSAISSVGRYASHRMSSSYRSGTRYCVG